MSVLDSFLDDSSGKSKALQDISEDEEEGEDNLFGNFKSKNKRLKKIGE